MHSRAAKVMCVRKSRNAEGNRFDMLPILAHVIVVCLCENCSWVKVAALCTCDCRGLHMTDFTATRLLAGELKETEVRHPKK